MNANRQVWGAKHPGSGVGGTNGAPPQQVNGGKRQPKEGMGANNMGARKPMEGNPNQRRDKNSDYSDEVETSLHLTSPRAQRHTACISAVAVRFVLAPFCAMPSLCS